MAGDASKYRAEIGRLYREGLNVSEITEYLRSVRGANVTESEVNAVLANEVSENSPERMVYQYNEVLEEAERQLLEVDLDVELKRIVLEARELRRLAVEKISTADKPREVEVWSRVWSYAAGEIAKIYKLLDDKKPIKTEKVWQVLKQLVDHEE